jgi:phospholipid/cholesterol/gamma-HCH transport system permease protein
MSVSAQLAETSPSGVRGAMENFAADWGLATLDALAAVGSLAVFAGQMFRWLFTRLPPRGTLLPVFYQVGVMSLPVVALTGMFIGMVLAIQGYYQFSVLGLESRLGAVINMSLVRELGPVLAATMLAGRVGSAMAAVLGAMRITEQIDALIMVGANPMHYLVVPRFLACMLMIPALTIVADFMGILGGYIYAVLILHVDHYDYLRYSQEFIGAFDFLCGIVKSIFFGGTIAIVSCHRGFHCEPGAEGVGRAATAAFVISFVLILIEDIALNLALDAIYFTIWPSGPKLL